MDTFLPSPTHFGFADETNWNEGDFRAVACVSFHSRNYETVVSQIREVWPQQCTRNTVKWSRLRSPNTRESAIAVLNAVVSLALQNMLRINVLIWYSKDWRNSIEHGEKRDEETNLQFMYRFLLRDLIHRCWGTPGEMFGDSRSVSWDLSLDRQKGVTFNILERDLYFYKSTLKRNLRVNVDEAASLEKGEEVNKDELDASILLTQVADIFAGMSAYSHNEFAGFLEWEKQEAGQLSLFSENETGLGSPAPQGKYRFPLIYDFSKLCSDYGMRVSLRNSQGLKTRDPNSRINFWVYEPRHPSSRVPTKPKTRLPLP